MNTPIESLLFYAKFLTGLLLVLNAALILCIRLNVKWLRRLTGTDTDEDSKRSTVRGSRMLIGLIIAVITVNALAIYGSNRLFSSVYEVTSQFSFTSSDFVQNDTMPN